MAVSATFSANFDKFFAAVEKADVQLRDFEGAASKVQSGINKLGNSFSGENIIKQALLTAEAIEKIGGATTLTDSEAKRVNATMTEALDKMRRLGVEIPPGIEKLASETNRAGKETSALGGVFGDVIGLAKQAAVAFGAMFAVGQIVGAVKSVISLGGELTDLSAKTGIGTTALQEFKYAGEQVGVGLDAITGGVNQLQKRLASDDDGAVGAVKKLGLSLDDLKGKRPEDQFKAIAEKVGGIEDPMLRTKAATDLFGKSGADLLPVLTTEFSELTRKADALGIVMDEQTVAAMDDLGDTASSLGSVALGALGRVIAPLIPLLSLLANIALQVASVLGDVLGVAMGYIVTASKKLADGFVSMAKFVLEGVSSIVGVIPGLKNVSAVTDGITWAMGKLESAHRALNETQPATVEKTKATGVAFEATSKQADKFAEAVRALLDEITGKKAKEELAIMAAAVTAAGGASKLSAFELENLAKKVGDLSRVGVEVPPVLFNIWLAHEKWSAAVTTNTDAILKLGGASAYASEQMRQFIPPLVALTSQPLENLFKLRSFDLSKFSVKPPDFSTAFEAALAHGLRAAADRIAGADSFAEAVGGLASGLASHLGANLQANGSGPLAKGIGSALVAASQAGSFTEGASVFMGKLGSTLGGMAGAAFGPLGSALGEMLGSFLGPLTSKITGLFGGVSAEVKKARSSIGEFEDGLRATLTASEKAEAGGVAWKETVIAVRDAYLATGRTAADAEAIVKQLWNDKDPKASAAAIATINGVLDEQKAKYADIRGQIDGLNGELSNLRDQNTVKFSDMKSIAEKYGISLKDLGPAFKQANISERAQEIIDAMETMKRGGADNAAVLHGLGDEISALVTDSIQFGTKIPENMRPMIEGLIKSGDLVDANGDKITDMAQINFGDPVADKFTKIADRMKEVADKIQALIDKMGGGMTTAAETAARNVTSSFESIPKDWDFNIRARVDTGGSGEGSGPGFALGTRGATGQWFRNFGAGTPTMLHGDEAVVRKDQAGDFAAEFGGAGAGMSSALLEEVRGLRSDFDRLQGSITRGVRDGLLLGAR